ncbi:hypothetical protein SAMN04488034_101322 [Salinimicrobium catena]|uniref:Uncharacterized protein n=1 Tax=Salinimicrobium catena TaxID=390640 RepID=A0A1H5I3V3_9FLAO|nr:hypothetical protein [Salinimicrobium catena]SDK74794.1 hypothetical protein SAMN04488140_101322 [Salinimicrobium catena]SEE34963.1 hypothetical protein SAMN04488034_101322 [Salinimicrobium catena]
MREFYRIITIVSLTVICGCSTDDTGKGETGARTETGIFIDSQVSGLKYTTETKSGVTDENGEFEYLEGETVTFYVGDILIGSGIAKENMNPIDIASSNNPDINSIEVKNIAAFLQSLDNDEDPSNGIEITASTVNAITVSSIDFMQPIEKVLGQIIAEVNMSTGSNLSVVYPEEAALHLAENLNLNYDVQNRIFMNFTPTIEDWIPKPPSSIYWVHETKEEGLLATSTLYEKYPNRVVYELRYKEYNSEGLPTSYELDIFENGELNFNEIVEIFYSESNLISKIEKVNMDNSRFEAVQFLELGSDLKIKAAVVQIQNENFNTIYREVYTHLPDGNRKTNSLYSNNGSEVTSVKIYTYNSAGDYLEIEINSPNSTATESFKYRNDHTLESWIKHDPGALSTGRTEEMFFDEEEKRTRWKVTAGDYITNFLYDVDGEGTDVIETYYKGTLIEVITAFADGTSIWKTINSDGSYKMEYKDQNSTITKTEFYDSNGNLIG